MFVQVRHTCIPTSYTINAWTWIDGMRYMHAKQFNLLTELMRATSNVTIAMLGMQGHISQDHLYTPESRVIIAVLHSDWSLVK